MSRVSAVSATSFATLVLSKVAPAAASYLETLVVPDDSTS